MGVQPEDLSQRRKAANARKEIEGVRACFSLRLSPALREEAVDFFTASSCHVCDPSQSHTSQKAAMYAPPAKSLEIGASQPTTFRLGFMGGALDRSDRKRFERIYQQRQIIKVRRAIEKRRMVFWFWNTVSYTKPVR